MRKHGIQKTLNTLNLLLQEIEKKIIKNSLITNDIVRTIRL